MKNSKKRTLIPVAAAGAIFAAGMLFPQEAHTHGQRDENQGGNIKTEIQADKPQNAMNENDPIAAKIAALEHGIQYEYGALKDAAGFAASASSNDKESALNAVYINESDDELTARNAKTARAADIEMDFADAVKFVLDGQSVRSVNSSHSNKFLTDLKDALLGIKGGEKNTSHLQRLKMLVELFEKQITRGLPKEDTKNVNISMNFLKKSGFYNGRYERSVSHDGRDYYTEYVYGEYVPNYETFTECEALEKCYQENVGNNFEQILHKNAADSVIYAATGRHSSYSEATHLVQYIYAIDGLEARLSEEQAQSKSMAEQSQNALTERTK